MLKQFLIQRLFPLVSILVFIICLVCFFFFHQFERNHFIYFILNSIVSIFCAYVAIVGIAWNLEENRKQEEEKKKEEALLQAMVLLNSSGDLFFNTLMMKKESLGVNLATYKINTHAIQTVLSSGVFIKYCPRGLMHLTHDIFSRANFLNLFIDTVVQDFLVHKNSLSSEISQEEVIKAIKEKLTKSPKDEIEILHVKVKGLHLGLKILTQNHKFNKTNKVIYKLIAEKCTTKECEQLLDDLIGKFNKTDFNEESFSQYIISVENSLVNN